MLINFCRHFLQPSVVCSTVSNDGYEVTNLISDSDNGFLAYSCIKPPIHIDFSFICDIQIDRVLVWPSVGAQKSSGFELCVKSSDDPSVEYKKVSSGFLNSTQSGILFYRRDVQYNGPNSPPDFLHRYIQVTNTQNVNRVGKLRLSILRTDNSVPAIGRIEIWGIVSRYCPKNIAAMVHALWLTNTVQLPNVEANNVSNTKEIDNDDRDSNEEGFNVPDCFLDPITWNVMIQPIVLPSGATIDQSTLEKHAKSEATWGRPLSDPFTGIPFNESRKPIVASALKARIDKFLLENKHIPDVIKMPRLSGHKHVSASLRNRSLELSEITSETTVVRNIYTREMTKSRNEQLAKPSTLSQSVKLPITVTHSKNSQQKRIHRLPVIPMCSKRVIVKKNVKTQNIKKIDKSVIRKEIDDIAKLLVVPKEDSNLDRNVQTVLSNLQRFDDENKTYNRECVKDCHCSTKVFYALPCNHIICRDTLTSIKNSKCPICHSHYNSGDPERIHKHS